MEKIMLVGGGLAGSLLSIYLARRGFEVHLFERRPDIRSNKISAGKSINLALSVRGINALQKAGLDQEILKEGIPMYGRMMHPVQGELAYQPYGTEGQAIYSVSRGNLNIQLLKLADQQENIHLYFNHKCIDIDYDKGIGYFENEKGETISYQADRIIGTDGAYAATRHRMQMSDRFDYSQSYLEHGYKELEILPADGDFALKNHCLHIWPRGSFMMIALPNPDKTFTCTLFFPYEGHPSFASLKTRDDVQRFFEQTFPDAVKLMPTLADDFFNNPTGSLVTVKCYPWVKGDKAALLGDAAHAIVPFFGQGMNCAFEDCVVLDECLEKYYPDWARVFSEYQEQRKPNADAIAELAVQNFIEMRDLVGQPDFLHKKHIEHELCELYPEHFQSQYELVTFTHTPYREAQNLGARNWQIVTDIVNQGLENCLNDRELILSLIRARA